MSVRSQLPRGLLVLGLLMLPVFAEARPLGEASPFHSHIAAGVEDVFAGRFDEGLAQCRRMIAMDPESPVGYFYEGATYWWMFLIQPENDAIGDKVEESLDLAVKKGERRLDADPEDLEALFYLGAAYGFRARHRIIRKQWWGAAWDGKKAKGLLEEVAAREPAWVDTQLGLGMYNYYVDVLPKYFQVLRVVAFIPSGDREKGIQQIRRAMQEGLYTRSEAQFFLVDIMKDHEKDYISALGLVRDLSRRYPDNPFFPLLEALIYVNHLGRWREAIAMLEDLISRLETSPFTFAGDVEIRARYFLAKAHFFRGDNRSALSEFEGLLARDPEGPEWVLAWTHLRLGQVYDLAGRREDAVREYQNVLEMEPYGKTHDAARDWIEEPFEGW